MSFSSILIHNYIVENKLISGDSVLDVGCGFGALAYLLKRSSNISVSGLDISKKAEDFNKKHKLYDRFISNKDEEIGIYDTVVCLEVLEHLIPNNPNLLEILQVLESVAYKRVIISVPAPYMTFNIKANNNRVRELKSRNELSDLETIQELADIHKQIVDYNFLSSIGYNPAFNLNLKTINGSLLFYKNISKNQPHEGSRGIFNSLFLIII